MLPQLVLLLPLLASVQALGGSHYVASREAKDIQKRDAQPEAAGIGGSHYKPMKVVVPPQARRAVEYLLDERGNIVLDERGMPITTTTTQTVPMTATNTVWVTDTDYYPEATDAPPTSTEDCEESTYGTPSPTGAPQSSAPQSSAPQPTASDPAVEPSDGNENPVLPPTTTSMIWWTAPTTPWWTPDQTVWWPPHSSAPVPSPSPSQATTDTPEEPEESTSAPPVVPTEAPTTSQEPENPEEPTSTSVYVPSPTNNLGTIMNGYYADWTAGILPPENIDWNVFDVMNYAFAEPNADATVSFSAWNSPEILNRVVAGAHAAGKKVVVSVGGWTGSTYFSSLVASPDLRSTFVRNLVNMVNTYKLDGLDIDWEYPGVMGNAGNQVSPSDTANYLVFLRQLRAALPQGSLITAATQVWPFIGPDGQSLNDVSEFAKIFDWILIMNYDIWGSSSTPGPNAPLSDGCKNSAQPTANAFAAVAAWEAAGMPANKITLGVPGYGYLQYSNADKLYNRRDRIWPVRPYQKRQSVTLLNSEGGSSNGQITFAGLVSQGALSLQGGKFVASGGFVRNWDECSSTPWLKSTSSGQIVTYDDIQSMNLKGQFAKQAGLRGASIWSLDGEYVNGHFVLSEAVRAGMGI